MTTAIIPAADTTSSYPHTLCTPFFKWAGGKRKLSKLILELGPKSFGDYYEPFLGAGAVFFALQPQRAYLGDMNAELVAAYYAIAFALPQVEAELREHAAAHRENDVRHYYRVREDDPGKMPPWKVAARFLYLNKAGFNGMYRVTKQGNFNVPLGDKGKEVSFDFENLRACSKVLRRALGPAEVSMLGRIDFRDLLETAKAGDFVYLDPPYVPASKTASFTAFTKDGFAEEDQLDLMEMFKMLVGEGVHCIASNSDTPWVREAYAGFRMVEVTRAGTMSSKADGRGKVAELLILGGTW